ncbi:unnamed protein product [Darwinula stevensoni]|uniref:Uncharacterized protein n=1 Tax=Darwinula stevensoni TaxID=69355 RepID=A0A7R8XFM5_9CRUS|nr:unnamed protein product [Darwinula stevensoni]CAG0888969.1 unnamed protein product [Darwinula stevensoni]
MGGPTWDIVGGRVGALAMEKRDILNEQTGEILKYFSLETWKAIDPDLNPSSPFTDWSYVRTSDKGEVPAVGGERKKRILELLQRKGVQWKDKDKPPVPLDMEYGVEGFLQGLSVILTGSLLHLPLLKT